MTVKEVSESIGYCGLVCKLCHLANQCGGCKSDFNCCGRHTSNEGCYQFNCCLSKNISGCWECDDFPCNNDMFSDSHDVRLRAFISCAKQEGIDKLNEYILINQKNGIQYGYNKDYDNLESELAVSDLLHISKKR